MEFDSKVALIQGLMKCQQRIHGSLNNLSSDDTEKLESIKTEVLKCVKDEEFGENDLRRLYFFLLLNTCRFEPMSSTLACDEDCGHLVSAIPALSDVLFVELVVALKLDTFLYESIVSLPPVLALEVVDLVSILFKGAYKRNPFQMITYLEVVLKAVIVKLFILESLSTQSLEIQGAESYCITPFNDKADSELCTRIKMKFLKHFDSLIANYASANADDYESLERNHLNYLCACIMKSLITVVRTCCQHFINPAAVNEGSNINEIFKVTSFDNNLETKSEIPVIENLKETCLRTVLSTFLKTAKDVTIELWMSWMDLEKFTDENMQMSIGNGMFHCLQYLDDETIKDVVNNKLYSELVMVATNMSIKPIAEEDEMKTADFNTIITNVRNPAKLQAKWLGLLIAHDEFRPSSEILKLIEEKSEVIVQNDAEILLQKSVDFLQLASNDNNTNPELCEHLKKVTLSAVGNFHIDHQMDILERFLEKNGLINILMLNGFDATMIELFNKTVDENDRVPIEVSSKILSLALQSPKDLLDKVFNESKSNKAQGRFMMKILKFLKPICSYHLKATEPTLLVSKVLEEIENASSMSDSEKENFIAFVVNLVNKFLIPVDDFANLYLWPGLSEAAEQNKHPCLLLWLEFAEKFVDGSVIIAGIQVSLPFCIVSLCQIINKFRCTLTEFDQRAIAVCDKAIDVLLCYADSLNVNSEEDTEIQWMISQLKQVDLLLQLHVISYVNHPGFNYIYESKGKEIYWLKTMFLEQNEEDTDYLDDLNKPMFSRVLMKALPYLTLKEWEMMFGNLTSKEDAKSMSKLFLACADVFLMLHSSVVPNFNKEEFDSEEIESTYNCLTFIVKNLISILQNLILPVVKRLQREEISELFLRLCFILKVFPRVVKENDEFVWLKILQDLISAADLPKSEDEVLTEAKPFYAGIVMITNSDLKMSLSEFIYSRIHSKSESE